MIISKEQLIKDKKKRKEKKGLLRVFNWFTHVCVCVCERGHSLANKRKKKESQMASTLRLRERERESVACVPSWWRWRWWFPEMVRRLFFYWQRMVSFFFFFFFFFFLLFLNTSVCVCVLSVWQLCRRQQSPMESNYKPMHFEKKKKKNVSLFS